MQYDYIGFLTAILIAVGGAIGYYKADSIPSLVAGFGFAIFLAIGAYFNSRSDTPPKPLFELCVLLILAGFMGYRWYNGSFMPSGLITCIAAGAFIINIIIYFNDLRNQFS